MARRGAPSFLTNPARVLFIRKAGVKESRSLRYISVISKTALSAPRILASGDENKSPAAIKTNDTRSPAVKVLVNIPSAFSALPSPRAMAYLVPPPTPIITQKPYIRLYTGIARLRAVSPDSPIPIEINNVSVNI